MHGYIYPFALIKYFTYTLKELLSLYTEYDCTLDSMFCSVCTEEDRVQYNPDITGYVTE